MNDENSTLLINKHEFTFCSPNRESLDVFIDFQGIMLMSNKGKALIPKELIDMVSIECKCISINVSANELWNSNMKKKFPIKYRLGLIRPYKAYTKIIGEFILSDLKVIKSEFEALGFNIG